MCGFAGAVGEVAYAHDAALRALQHRGPDDSGRFDCTSGLARLTHTRFAIQDLSDAGHQPMCSADGRYVIAYNGEIYNVRELREMLSADGVALKSHCDTEILIEGWARFGFRFVERCRGMFAFALWDTRERNLWLVRDRLGIKPLYYGRLGDGLVFGSELRAVVAATGLPVGVSPAGVESTLRFGAVRGPRTILKHAELLAPGSWLRWSPSGVTKGTYWSLADVTGAPRSQATLEEIAHVLAQSVRMRLVGDVPVGALLSGGIDSSAISALAADGHPSGIEAYTVGFEALSDTPDEIPEAAAWAAKIGARHHPVWIDGEQLEGALAGYWDAIDQPSEDGLNTYVVTRALWQHGVKVALTGLGGDELFLGYPSAWTLERDLRSMRATALVRRFASRVLRMPGMTVWRLPLRAAKAVELVHTPAAVEDWVDLRRTLFTAEQRRSLMAAPSGEDSCAPAPGTELQRWSQAELTGYMGNTLLRDADVFSMAHPVELRVPLIDHALIEAVLPLPDSIRYTPGHNKALLVRAVGTLDSDQVARSKRGFSLPRHAWLIGSLRERAEAVFADRPFWEGVGVRPEAVRAVWNVFRRAPSLATVSRPWTLLALHASVTNLRAAKEAAV